MNTPLDLPTTHPELIILRAHNEEEHIGHVIESVLALSPKRLVVINSASTDSTVAIAQSAGAEVFTSSYGLGNTTRKAFGVAEGAPFVLLDSDLLSVNLSAIASLWYLASEGIAGRGKFDAPGRSSSLLVEQAVSLQVQLPPLAPQSLTTAYTSWPVGTAARIDLTQIPPKRGSDLTLAILAHRAGIPMREVLVGPRLHRNRGDGHIQTMVDANYQALMHLKTLPVL